MGAPRTRQNNDPIGVSGVEAKDDRIRPPVHRAGDDLERRDPFARIRKMAPDAKSPAFFGKFEVFRDVTAKALV